MSMSEKFERLLDHLGMSIRTLQRLSKMIGSEIRLTSSTDQEFYDLMKELYDDSMRKLRNDISELDKSKNKEEERP